ncbi:hypothetical protein BM524_13200 [Alteromonas mediterranea]|uniref:Lipoprotein n=2 Tax=Alteromonas mediterranea TaxID=314275 RepID=A0AAC9JDT2_9ALTE|nr:hypothetical protein BM524_13200 [Alteromonas mediterranea]
MDVARAIFLLVLSSSIIIAGCSSSGFKSSEPLTVTFDAEAASTHISIDSVGSWYSYSDALQPNYEMTEQNALNAVVPTNLHFEEAIRNAFGASLQLAPSTSSITESFTTSFDPAGNEETTGTRTRARNPGDSSSISLPNTSSLLPSQANDSDDLTGGDGSDFQTAPQKVDLDPFLRYSAATSLYQEIELINRYIKDAALKKDVKPYLVRMNVNLMPKARNLPYDTYINVSMFSEKQDVELPTVLPLLVSDNIEAAMQSRSNTDLLNLAFGLSLLNAGNFGSIGLDNYSEKFQSVFGRDMNSLLSVTRSSSNTLKIRLGANLSSGNVYSMIPRNHKISFVVLAPRQVEEIQIVSKSEFVHATTGKSLKANTTNFITPQVIRVLEDAGCSKNGVNVAKEEKSRLIANILDSVLYSNYGRFQRELEICEAEAIPESNISKKLVQVAVDCEENETLDICFRRKFAESECENCDETDTKNDSVSVKKMVERAVVSEELNVDDSFNLRQAWVSLTRINEYRNVNVSDISLPPIHTHAQIPDIQTVLLADDGKTSTKGQINGIRQPSNSTLRPALKLDKNVIVPSLYSFDKTRGTLSFSLPSLTAIGFVKDGKLTTTANCVEVIQEHRLSLHDEIKIETSECMPIKVFMDKTKAKSKDALFKLTSSTKTIVTSDGTGTVSFYVDIMQKKDASGVSKPESEATLSIDGAKFTVDTTSPLITLKGRNVVVSNSVMINAEFDNLSENNQVVITGTDKAKTSSNTLIFPIKEVKAK